MNDRLPASGGNPPEIWMIDTHKHTKTCQLVWDYPMANVDC
jgi:hypothetical protein